MPEATAVLTRDPDDNVVVSARLGERGIRVLEVPCVRAVPLEDASALDAAVAALCADDVLAVTSRSGADAIARAGAATTAATVAAVGGATAQRLRALGIAPRFVPTTADGAALARELPLPKGRVVLARSDRARSDVPAILAERGARVENVVAYRTVAAAYGAVGQARDAIGDGGVVVVALASPSALDALLTALGDDLVRRARLVAIGATTASHASTLGFTARIASRPDADALFDAITAEVAR